MTGVAPGSLPRTRCSRRCARRRPSRRPSTGSARRSSSACCRPAPSCRPSGSCAEARNRPLDTAPGADGAGQSGHVFATRGRSGGTFVADPSRRPSRPPAMLAQWREVCDQRLAIEVGVAVLAAERADAADLDALEGAGRRRWSRARGLHRLPPGRRPPARRARRGDRRDPADRGETAAQGEMTALIR